MNLHQTFKFSLIALLVFFIASCENSNEYIASYPSSDAQIYGFKVECEANNALDSINYPIMAKTKFAIDQFKQLIYNPDSLPYRTVLRKFLPTVAFGSSDVSDVKVQYANDSIADWDGESDSIDFSTPLYPKFIVTARDGITKKTYTVDIRVHQVNPELMIWENVSEKIQQPTTIYDHKTFLKGNTFYTFSIDTDNKLYLHKAEKSGAYNSKTSLSGLPSSEKFDLHGIILFNNVFYAVDTDKKGYSSEDGISWEEKGSGIESLLGVVPAKDRSDDFLLVVTKSGDGYSFSKTTDLNNFTPIRSLSKQENEKIPTTAFSSITNFDRNNIDKNLLMVTGGTCLNNESSNRTWLIQVAHDNTLRLIINDEHNFFSPTETVACYIYDNKLYALVEDRLYKSISFGSRWTKTTADEGISAFMSRTYGQSVIVDEENYVWIFSGIYRDRPMHEVWRGRLNRLSPKR